MASANEPILSLPVSKTGVYRNSQVGQFEFWFVYNGKGAMIGACRFEVPKTQRERWARDTRQQLTAMVASAMTVAAEIKRARQKHEETHFW